MTQIIVCAAIRNRNNGVVICGPRHGNCIETAVFCDTGDEPINNSTWEYGFVDAQNNFLTRSEAWRVADRAGQIRRPTGFEQNYDSARPANVGDTGLLFSENLY